MPPATHPLALTGERTLPGIAHERYWFARHLVAYRYAADVLGRRLSGRVGAAGGTEQPTVLDAGCGEGYGADLLRTSLAARVVALDYDAGAIGHVGEAYPGVVPVRGNLVAVSVRSGSCAAVVSLQTVEHVWDQPAFLAECARVLEPGGVLVLSTPNRLTFTTGAPNPFHAHELDAAELRALVAAAATGPAILGVHHGPRVRAFAQEYGDPVAAQLAAPADRWDAELAAFVADVRPDDFVVAADGAGHRLDDALDLLATAVRARSDGA